MSELPDSAVADQYGAAGAAAARGDTDAYFNSLLGAKPAAAPAPAAGAPPPPAIPAAPEALPVGKRMDWTGVALSALPFVGPALSQPGALDFAGRLKDAAAGGALQSLRDLGGGIAAVGGGKAEAVPTGADAQPLTWADLKDPETALAKSVYQLAHGAPVLAAGVAGAAAGGAALSEAGPGAAAGALGGGALGAGAMSAAEGLGPFYAAELRRTPADPAGAFDRAFARAGTEGVFTAAGWAAFGAKPFAGAVKNLLFQAFGVQPAVAAAGQVAQNAETGQPLGQGVAATVPGAVVGTALPAIAGAAIGARAENSAAGEGEAPPAATGAAAEGETVPAAPAAPSEASAATPPAAASEPAPAAPAESGAAGSGTASPLVRTGDLWRMAPEDLDRLAESSKASDADRIAQALGADRAAEFTRLDRARNSWNPSVADKASAEFDEKFGDLTPAQEKLIYGSAADPEATPEDIQTVREAHQVLTDLSPDRVGWEATLGLRRVPPAEILAVPKGDASPPAQAAFVQLMNGYGELTSRGIPADEVPRYLVGGMVAHAGMSPGDAADFVGHFLDVARAQGKGAGSATESEAAPLLLPGPSAAPGATPDQAPPVPEIQEPPAPFTIGERQDAVRPTPDEADQARRFLAGDSGDNPVQASLEGLARQPDLNATLAQLASFVPRDGVKPDDVLRMNAYSTGGDLDQALTGLKGALPSDEQVGAYAMLLNASGSAFRDMAAKAVASGEPDDMAEAVRGYAVMNRLVSAWTEAGTEQGRALRARQLAWDARSDLVQQFQDIVARTGPDAVDEIVRKVGTLQDPAKVSPFVASLRWMSSRDGLLYGWYNALLSNPATVVKKVASDASMAFWNVAARSWAERFGSGAVVPGESMALLHGYIGSFQDGLRAASLGIKQGTSGFATEYQGLDGQLRQRLSLLAAGHAADPATPTANGVAYLRAALPTGWIGAADDFAKAVNYRAELRALAWRDATKAGLDGQDFDQRMADSLNAPPQAMHEQAVTAAMRNTFSEPLTGIAATVQSLADGMNVPIGGRGFQLPVGRILLPFVRTPANIMKEAYRFSPAPLLFPSSAFRAELAAGGASRNLALAKVGLGTGVTLGALGLSLAGTMTGSGPSAPELHRAWLAAGNQPHSIRIGDQWYGYNKIEPLGLMLGTVADTVDVMKFARQQDNEQLAASLVFGVGQSLLSKTYLTGISDFFDALHQPDQQGDRYVANLLASFAVPQGVAGLERATDDWRRQHQGLLETIESRIPGLAEGLPPQRTLWGDPIPWQEGYLPGLTGTGVARLLSPIPTAPATAEPIDTWIWQNRDAFAQGPNGRLGLDVPGRVQSFAAGPHVAAQIELSPAEYDRFRVLAGNGLKADGLGAKDLLNALVEGRGPDGQQAGWDRASPAEQAIAVQSVVRKYQNAAKQRLLAEFPDVRDAVTAGWQQRQQQLQTSAAAAPAPAANGVRAPSFGGQ